jgi:hypothetical protein
VTRRNFPVRYVNRRPKRSEFDIYDELPAEIRAALQEGPCNWSSRGIAHRYRKLCREVGEAEAIASAVVMVNKMHEQDISRGRDWWPKHPKRGWMYNSPHFSAHATMQTSGRDQSP